MGLRRHMYKLIAAVALLASLAAPALSNSPVFATTNCLGGGCESTGLWQGTTNGMSSTFTASNPGLHSGEYWTRHIYLNDSGGDILEMGITKGIYCGSSTTLYYYYFYNLNTPVCQPVPSNQINIDQTFKMGNFTSNGGGMLLQFPTQMSGCGNSLNCFLGGLPQTYNLANIDETIVASVNGHEVWGSHWIDNMYKNGTGWHEQVRNFDSLGAEVPPQMYWHTVPSTSHPGGELYSCVYDSTVNTCTYGS